MTDKEFKARKRIFLADFETLFKRLKPTIQDDACPSMCVTIGTDDAMESWSYQTGDNSYSGGAYGYPHWAVVTLLRRSNCKKLAMEAFSELVDRIPETEE